MWYNVKLDDQYADHIRDLLRVARNIYGEAEVSKADLFRLFIDFVIANKSLFLSFCLKNKADDIVVNN
jgi:hypothetical protein